MQVELLLIQAKDAANLPDSQMDLLTGHLASITCTNQSHDERGVWHSFFDLQQPAGETTSFPAACVDGFGVQCTIRLSMGMPSWQVCL